MPKHTHTPHSKLLRVKPADEPEVHYAPPAHLMPDMTFTPRQVAAIVEAGRRLLAATHRSTGSEEGAIAWQDLDDLINPQPVVWDEPNDQTTNDLLDLSRALGAE